MILKEFDLNKHIESEKAESYIEGNTEGRAEVQHLILLNAKTTC